MLNFGRLTRKFIFKQCFGPSWYLAVDFQLFVLSPILIYPLWRWRNKFFFMLPVIVVLNQVCIFATTYKYRIKPIYFTGDSMDWFSKFYFVTHMRVGSWVVGIMLGYIMFQSREKKVKIPKVLDSFLWILSFGTLAALILGMYPFQRNVTTQFINSLYNACFRVFWCYAVGWMIFACHNGTGGLVRWFLSLRQWQPLGKLGLCIYLVHSAYQKTSFLNEKFPIDWNIFSQIQLYFADVVVSLFLATFFYLAVENPIFIIENYVHKLRKEKLKTLAWRGDHRRGWTESIKWRYWHYLLIIQVSTGMRKAR